MSKRKYPVPDETARRQSAASDPRKSVWVSANAGSGKTHVLAQRVVRLLLEGTHPSKILCLTYTRAAAANMSNRVFSILAGWTTLGDDELARAVAAIDGQGADAKKLKLARKLFAEALETPGGLKIQTIHAFCESVLHQFPLEANIAAHFELLDPRMEDVLFGEARREMLTGAVASDPALAEAFAMVLERGGEAGLDALLTEIVRRRDGLRAFIDHLGRDAAPHHSLFAEFDFDAADTAEGLANSIWPLPGFSTDFLERFVEASVQTDAGNVQKYILPNAMLAFAEPDAVKRLALLAAGFLKSNGEPYGASTFKKALLGRMPDLLERYANAASVIAAASNRLALLRMLEGTGAALTIADWMIAQYEKLKSARGFLDFNDLIARTIRLLGRTDAGAWVQYKLDQGIDHILLDEAQDTSPQQWSVVRRLAGEFFAGLGARDTVLRTIFAVGDEKQSIYSFQGAVPEAFAETGKEFGQKVREAEAGFEELRLTLSFRSTNDVLHAVDKVFAGDQARRGLTHDADPVKHDAIRFDAPGYVELWPSIPAPQVEEPDDWSQAIDHAQAPAVLVAETVARTIRHWLDRGETVEGTGKLLAPGDIMVLVRKRDRFVHALARSLKNKDVPVAGADRLSLPGHIAVQDLIALGKVLLQPEDDLSLAALLSSPVFGLSEDTLFDLAAGRPATRSLLASLQASKDPGLAAIAERLDRWSTEAAFKPPFDFYSGVLGRDGVRRDMIARLGHEAGDILDEFLNFCLAEERAGLPGLEAFLATLESSGPEIKREMDQGRDEVRIMTVHAAKGLEAPVVFLVDGGAAPFHGQHLPRLMPFDLRKGAWRGPGYVWRSASDIANGFAREAEARIAERADDEYRRLLYVGMTRAEDRLIVCGYHGKKAQHAASWHSIVERALVGAAETSEVAHPVTGEPIHRFRVTKDPPVQATDDIPATTLPSLAETLPAALFAPLPLEEDLPRPLSPSRASLLIEDTPEPSVSSRSPVLDGVEVAGAAVLRGLAIHKLLQMLPDMPRERREAAALRYLLRASPDWNDAECAAAWDRTKAILDAPDFASVFGPGSRAEVAVMGNLTVRGKSRVVSGKIDRLAVSDDVVRIVDYKTNRPPPGSFAEVPDAYVIQLALYRDLLKPLYPGRRIEAALLFTEAPRLIALPADEMDAALARLTRE